MKYYLYISDAKVNMLYEQIPNRLRNRLATELKIDLKLLSTTFTEPHPEPTRFMKLKMVTEYIYKHEQPGTVDEPNSFFLRRNTLNVDKFPENSNDVLGRIYSALRARTNRL